jgi:hypothetical protein
MPTPTLASFMAYWHAFGITWPKQKPVNGWGDCRGSHDTTKVRVVVREFKLVHSSLTYAMTLFVTLNFTNKTFTYFARATLEVLGGSNSPTIMWQGVNEIDYQGKIVIA